MPVYGTTKATEILYKRQSLQRITTENCYSFPKQRSNVLELQSRLFGEFQRQNRLHELKKKERYTGYFPPLCKQTCEQNNSQMISTFSSNIRHFKPIKKRVSSAAGNSFNVTCNRRYVLEDSQMCRHFCELLGPNLCVDCTKLRERLDALREDEVPPAPLHLERDPFTALVCSHYSKECESDDFNEELINDLSDNEDLEYGAEIQRKQSPVSKVYFTPSPPGRGDSGYSSRVSYIKDLTRPHSCGPLLRSRFPMSPSIPFRREKTYEARMRDVRTQDSRNSSGLSSLEESPDNYGFTTTLEKLQKRKENFGLDAKWAERSKGPLLSWQKTPVEPILMELKLINFTQYDKLGYGPPEPEPEPPKPVIPTDEFGFPILDTCNIQVSSL